MFIWAIIFSKVTSKSPIMQKMLKRDFLLSDYYLMLFCGFDCGDSRH